MEAVTIASLITEGIAGITAAVGGAWDILTSNILGVFYTAVGVSGVGFGLLKGFVSRGV